MPSSHTILDNPDSKGNLYEDRHFADDDDLRRMLTIVKPGTFADVWWQMDCLGDGKTIQLVTGSKPATPFVLRPMQGVDRIVINEAGEMFECRRFPSDARKGQELKVIPPIEISGYVRKAWWTEDYATDHKGPRTLRTGLRVDKTAKVVTGDGLDAMNKDQLLTHAGINSVKDVNKEMTEGEIMAKIRAAKSAKAAKPVKPTKELQPV